MYLFYFYLKCTIQTDLRGERNLKTKYILSICIHRTYCEILGKRMNSWVETTNASVQQAQLLLEM